MAKRRDDSASRGGDERARRLSEEDRRRIARDAAAARWEREGKDAVLAATHEGTLKIGELLIPCAVLEDGSRVLSETGMVEALGMYRSGAVLVRSQTQEGNRLPLFVANKNVALFIDDDLSAKLMKPKWFFPKGAGKKNRGVDATLIPGICNVWLKARDAGVLAGNQRQELVAAKADILIRGLAEVGIVALVDEATGYQDVRARDALAKILEAFVATELQKWIPRFDPAYFKELCRLRGWQFKESYRLPRVAGKYTDDLVYKRLAPGVRDELRRLNPTNSSGQRKAKHHQWLTGDVGHPKLSQHLSAVIALMRAADDWDMFMKLVNRSLPRQIALPLLDAIDPPEKDGGEIISSD